MAAGDEVRIRVRLQGARQAQQQARAAGQAMGEVGVETEQAGKKARKSVKDFDVVGKAMDGLKRMGAAAGLAAGGALAAGLASTVTMDSANNKLSAQLGLTGPMSERAGRMAGELYREAWGDSVEHVNQALGSVMSGIPGMASASQGAIKALTGTALDFATAFEVDVAQAVATAGYLMEAGLARSGTEAFDLLTAASQRVPAALRGELLEASEEYAQFFGSLGYNGQQAFALLVDAAGKGRYGLDKTGDAIKEFSIRSTDMSTTSQEAYAAMGMDAQTMANKILAGGDSAYRGTQEIINGLLGIKDPAKQAEAAIALFGTPIEDLNVGEIPEFLKGLRGGSKSMDGFGGAAGRMGEAINQGPAYQFTLLKRAIETFLGTRILPFVLENKKAFGGLAAAIGGLLVLRGVIGAVNTLKAAFVGLKVANGVVSGIVGNVRGMGPQLATAAGSTRTHMTKTMGSVGRSGGTAAATGVASTTASRMPASLATHQGRFNGAFRTVGRTAGGAAGATASAHVAGGMTTALPGSLDARKGRIGGAFRSAGRLAGRAFGVAAAAMIAYEVYKQSEELQDAFPVQTGGSDGGMRIPLLGPYLNDLLPGKATGGSIYRGGPYIVGELGPEIVNLSAGDHVTSNALSAPLLAPSALNAPLLAPSASSAPDRVDVGMLAESLPARAEPRKRRRDDWPPIILQVDGREVARVTGKQVADQLARR